MTLVFSKASVAHAASSLVVSGWLEEDDTNDYFVPQARSHLDEALPCAAKDNRENFTATNEDDTTIILLAPRQEESDLAKRNFFLLMAFARAFHQNG